MAINKITAPLSTGPNVFAAPVINWLQALLNDCNHGDRINDTYVLKGALFSIGGSMFLADSDTAISGTRFASQFIKFVVSGLLATPYYADITTSDLTWNGSYNGYYDSEGNLYYKGLSSYSPTETSSVLTGETSFTAGTSATVSKTGTYDVIISYNNPAGSGYIGYAYCAINGTQFGDTVSTSSSTRQYTNLGRVHLTAGDIFIVYGKISSWAQLRTVSATVSLTAVS